MRIAIDISPIVYKSGVSHYTEMLVRNLLQIDNKNEYVLVGFSLRQNEDLVSFANTLTGNFVTKFSKLPPALIEPAFNTFRLPIEAFTGKVDVFHSSDWTQPTSSAFKVTTVHDLGFIKFPGLQHPKIERVAPKRLAHVKSEANRVIVPSYSTKLDLEEEGFSSKKIRVIPEAPSFAKASGKSVSKVLKKFGLGKKFLLAVGVNPRKNSERIAEAYEKVKSKLKMDLVFFGTPSHVLIREGNGIRLLGRVSDEEAAALYTGAQVLVYPSLYEGFGLPVLDAFACETPVVTSIASSLPEVAQNAAVLVDPESISAIADGILEALAKSDNLVGRGKVQVAKYSWEKAAKATMEVYNEASRRP